MSRAPQTRIGALASVALALGVLNLLLAHGNAWPTLWPAAEWRLALELAPAVGVVAGWGGLSGRAARRARWSRSRAIRLSADPPPPSKT